MKISRIIRFILVFCVLASAACAKTTFSHEQIMLRNLGAAIQQYLHDHHDRMPVNLESLKEYADWSKICGPSFPEKYTFLLQRPKVSLPEQRDVQLLLLAVEPKHGWRAAIWITAEGNFDLGYLSEEQLQKDKSVDWNALRPMGGSVPGDPAKESPK